MTNSPSPSNNSVAPAFDLVNSIKELQDLEQWMFQKLEAANIAKSPNVNDQNDIIKHINELSDLRNNLFGQLGKIYVNLDKNSQIERSALTDQITTTNMMEQQLNNLKDEVGRILETRTNKMRMVEIGEYEYLRYSAHKSAMKTIAFTSLALLVFSILFKNHMLPDIIIKIGIIGTVSIGGVILGKQIWDMVTRDNQNYNRYKQGDFTDAMFKGSDDYKDTVWAHDKKFFEQIWALGKKEADLGWDDMKKVYNKGKSIIDSGANETLCNAKAVRDQDWSWDANNNCCRNSKTGACDKSVDPTSEGFQVVRAFQAGNKLIGAPFN